MNTRDVFLQHIESIRQFTEAEAVSVFHPEVHPSIGQITLGNQAFALPSFSSQEVLEIEKLKHQRSPCNTMLVYAHGDCHLSFKLLENPLPNNAVEKQTLSSPEQSRRAPIETYDNDIWYWINISFGKQKPAWLDGLVEGSLFEADNSPQLPLFCQLLKSASLQIKLIDNYISLQSDPLTQLCSRTILQNRIALLGKHHSVGLIMIHCIDFQKINKKFGHDHGDKIIREIAGELKSITREDDILSRFGGALFGVAFPVNEQLNVASLASKLQNILQKKQYLDGAINLHFDIGAALIHHDETYKTDFERAVSLINLADQALKVAQQEAQPSIIVWQNEDLSLHQPTFQYSGGIFTADTVTDYRNMLLLWDISTIIADKHDFLALLQSAIHRLAQTFEFQHAGLLSGEGIDNPEHQFVIDELDQATPIQSPNEKLIISLKQLQARVLEKNKPLEKYVGDSLLLVLPLETSESNDCFFIVGHAASFDVTFDTKTLLSGLTKQIGKALRRSQLEEQLNRKLTSQNEKLQSELVQLKEGLQNSSLVYQSSAMRSLMKQAQRAAVTDTTILITGESGTGKERLLHALHQLGNRNDQPLIIVDCGSIPETLIESELFGYVKGAFTGAQNSSSGKILDADGGVLVLDEIGELPIQMQSKLLRFVQEKHFTPVGGTKLIDVDVKIVAVTNRDLEQEVDKGTFRKDLYYRLNVLTLHNPPLRDRIEDIPLLSSHFLNKFAEQFSVQRKRLSSEALYRMQQYTWPGNIRELENRLMQATLLCEGVEIAWPLLNIEDTLVCFTDETPSIEKELSVSSIVNATRNLNSEKGFVPTDIQHQNEKPVKPNENIRLNYTECSTKLKSVIGYALTQTNNDSTFFNVPFGLWVEDEFVLQTYVATNKNMRNTAARLNISLSTARRRVEKLNKQREVDSPKRPESWPELIEALKPFAHGQAVLNQGIADLKLLTLGVVLQSPVSSMSDAANILGVSEPTFYKLKRELEVTSAH
ncbi:diguanylate cyclase [Alteromonadaceae bacterium M269]|nr:diguanylate cyclase [Alteromonadaceae bacterium M269]